MPVDSMTKQRIAISNRNMLIKKQQELICDLLHAVNDGCITSKIQEIKAKMNNRNELQHEYCDTLRDFKTSPEQAETTYQLAYEMLSIDNRIFAMASDALRLVKTKPEERMKLKHIELLLTDNHVRLNPSFKPTDHGKDISEVITISDEQAKEAEDFINSISCVENCPARRMDLEYCDTREEVDAILSKEHDSIESKLRYLFDYMGIKSAFYDGGIENDTNIQYDFAIDAFLSGNWRALN